MKEGKSQKNFKISIRAKILTGMIACVLIVTNLIGWFFIVQAKDTLLEQCKNNARNSAKIAAERIDGDILEQIKAGDEETENYKEILKEIKNLGLKGIKLHPDYQDMYFDDIRYEHIVDTASELGLITVVHAGADPKCPKDVHCTPKMARKLLDDVKPEKLVLAHMGGNEMWDEVEKYLVGQNVYFDTGVILDRMPEEQFLRMVHMHGADRILFGTDSPWADQKKFVTLFDQMPLTEEEKMAVFSGNAKKLLGI